MGFDSVAKKLIVCKSVGSIDGVRLEEYLNQSKAACESVHLSMRSRIEHKVAQEIID